MLQSWHREISQFAWKALSIATLATIMIACIAGVFDNGDAITAPVSQHQPASSPAQ